MTTIGGASELGGGATRDSRRRSPSQARSRQRVAAILDATAQLVVKDGVDSITTRAIATAAGMPVASLYQYFADKEAVLLALVERDMAEMEAKAQAELSALRPLSIADVVSTTLESYAEVFKSRPAFVEIYLHGRTNSAVMGYTRAHNTRLTQWLYALSGSAGVLKEDTPMQVVRLAIEIGDRVLQVAFEGDRSGDRRLLNDGIELISAYLSGYLAEPSQWRIPQAPTS